VAATNLCVDLRKENHRGVAGCGEYLVVPLVRAEKECNVGETRRKHGTRHGEEQLN
jgi:hypothetical protein